MIEVNKKIGKRQKLYSCYCSDENPYRTIKVKTGSEINKRIRITIKNNGNKSLPLSFQIKNHPDNKILFDEIDVNNEKEIEPKTTFKLDLNFKISSEITENNYLVIGKIEIKNYEPFEAFQYYIDVKRIEDQNKTPNGFCQLNVSHQNNSQDKSINTELRNAHTEKMPLHKVEKENNELQLEQIKEVISKEYEKQRETLENKINQLEKENETLKQENEKQRETLENKINQLVKENETLKQENEKLCQGFLFCWTEMEKKENESNITQQIPNTFSTNEMENTRLIEISTLGPENQSKGIIKDTTTNNNNYYTKFSNSTDDNQQSSITPKDEVILSAHNKTDNDSHCFSNINNNNITINTVINLMNRKDTDGQSNSKKKEKNTQMKYNTPY